MIFRLFSVLLAALILAACEHPPIKDESSEFYSVPVGSTLVLNSEITIPPDEVSILMQNGVIEKSANINFYYPNCKFELYSMSENARVVRPDSFQITKVVDENEFTDLQKTGYAGLGGMVHDAPETITYATVMYLNSEIQPDVYRMTCKHWESIIDNKYLSISEMRKAMGEIFTLNIGY
jgi:hypothetical protein